MKIDKKYIEIKYTTPHGFYCNYNPTKDPFEAKYIHKDGTIHNTCGIENFHTTAEEAGRTMDKCIKLYDPVKVTREQIAFSQNIPMNNEIVD